MYIVDDGSKAATVAIVAIEKSYIIKAPSESERHFINHIKRAIANLVPNNDIGTQLFTLLCL